MPKMTLSKEERKIAKTIKPYGYYIEKGKKHRKIRNAEGTLLIAFAGTPSDPHWHKNVINQLIKNGQLDIPKW